jgi:hypothetical protein
MEYYLIETNDENGVKGVGSTPAAVTAILVYQPNGVKDDTFVGGHP